MSDSLTPQAGNLPLSNMSQEEFVTWFSKLDDDTRYTNEANREFKNAYVIFDQPGETAKVKAMKRFAEFADKYPDDFRGYWGMLEAITSHFKRMIPNAEHLTSKHPDTSSIRSIYHKAMQYADGLKDGTTQKIENAYAVWEDERKQHWNDKKREIFQPAEDEIATLNNAIGQNVQEINGKQARIGGLQNQSNDLNARLSDLQNRQQQEQARYGAEAASASAKARKKANMLNMIFRAVVLILIALVLFVLFATIINNGIVAFVLMVILAILPLVAKFVPKIGFIGKPYAGIWNLIKKVDMIKFVKVQGPAGFTDYTGEMERLKGEISALINEISQLTHEIGNLREVIAQYEKKKLAVEEGAKREFALKIESIFDQLNEYLPIAKNFGL